MKKADKLPELRRLYIGGNALAVAAKMAGVSRGSATVWRAEDEAASGEDWDALRRKQLSQNPMAPLDSAREYLQWLLDNQRALRIEKGFSDSLWKANDTVERMEAALFAKANDWERARPVLKLFAWWAEANIKEDDALAIVGSATTRFMNDLKAGKVEAPRQ